VIDAPGGGGKVPMNPDFVESITDTEIVFKNYEGKVFKYPLKNTIINNRDPDYITQNTHSEIIA